MTRRQRNQSQALLRYEEFNETLLADFTHQPPTAAARSRLAAKKMIVMSKPHLPQI
jgi:hypothetical protein